MFFFSPPCSSEQFLPSLLSLLTNTAEPNVVKLWFNFTEEEVPCFQEIWAAVTLLCMSLIKHDFCT